MTCPIILTMEITKAAYMPWTGKGDQPLPKKRLTKELL
jgi:hypothetical protein